MLSRHLGKQDRRRLKTQLSEVIEFVYQTYRSDPRTRTSDENGFVEEARRIEKGHGTDVSGAEPKYIRH